MAEALTLEEAASEPLDGESLGQLTPYQDYSAPEPEYGLRDFSETLPMTESITLEQAVGLLSDDDDVRALGTSEKAVAVVDGHPVTLTELVQGYVNGANLRYAADQLAGQFLAVERTADNVMTSVGAIADLMIANLPAEPNPAMLQTNMSGYLFQKDVRERGIENIQLVAGHALQAKAASDQMAAQQGAWILDHEYKKLVDVFPECATQAGREAFLDKVREACYSCDFTEKDLRSAGDHRLYRLAQLAAVGFEHLEQRKSNPRPKKGRRKQTSSAMARLRQTGSIEDAMLVDFD